MSIKEIVLISAMALASSGALAEQTDNQEGFTLSPMVGKYHFDKNREIEDDTLLSIGLGYQFNSPWALEFVYLQAEGDDERNRGDIDLTQMRLDALYHFSRNQNSQPYLAFGLGNNDFDGDLGSDEETLINAGGGINYFVSDALSLRGDVRFINSLDEEDTDIALSVGLRYAFGASPQPMKKVPAVIAPVDGDGDNDGVADSADRCPNTETGVKVGDRGCAVMVSERFDIALEVRFDTDSAMVRDGERNDVAELARFMTDFPNTRVVIEGHTDDTGAAAYNQRLSESRATAVAALLVEQYQIAASRVESRGFGESRPLAASTKANYRAINRRVVAGISVEVERAEKK